MRVCELVCVCVGFLWLIKPFISIFSWAADLRPPLSPSVPVGLKMWTLSFSDTNTQTYSRAGTKTHTHFILKQLWACGREVGCAKVIMWYVGTLLDGASSFSPYSEVTLSFQSALQMNWALCQWWSSLVKQKSECEATLLLERPLTILLSLDIHYTHRLHTYTLQHVLTMCSVFIFLDALLVQTD